jgi:hypothetical protein
MRFDILGWSTTERHLKRLPDFKLALQLLSKKKPSTGAVKKAV